MRDDNDKRARALVEERKALLERTSRDSRICYLGHSLVWGTAGDLFLRACFYDPAAGGRRYIQVPL